MKKAPIQTVGISTLGCRVNQYESQALIESIERLGLQSLPFSSVCDIYIINTCAVTAESSRKSIQMIHRAHKQNPNAPIFVTGCEAQRAKESLLQNEGVFAVYGNRQKKKILADLQALLCENATLRGPICDCTALDAPYESMSITRSERTRAYVKIEDGCNGKCAYCIIPSLRGSVCSRPMEDILCEIHRLAECGYKEVVLTGIETAAYQEGLAKLLCQVNEIKGIERIRLGSMDPASIRPDFIDTITSLSHFMPHFHLSLQSGCDQTLARMRRRYRCEQVRESISYLREKMPRVQFSADIIVGFPQETPQEFEQTYAFLEELGLCSMHVFPYSKRPGTPAAEMSGQVQKEEKMRRAKALANLAKKSFLRQMQPYLYTPVPVLFERTQGGFSYGHTDHFQPVRTPALPHCHNQIRMVHIQTAEDGFLTGTAE